MLAALQTPRAYGTGKVVNGGADIAARDGPNISYRLETLRPSSSISTRAGSYGTVTVRVSVGRPAPQ